LQQLSVQPSHEVLQAACVATTNTPGVLEYKEEFMPGGSQDVS
jgi:hypothetical protein